MISNPNEFNGLPPPHWVHACPRCSHLVSRDEASALNWRGIVASCSSPDHRTFSALWARFMNPCFIGIAGITVLLLAASASQLIVQSLRSPPTLEEPVPDAPVERNWWLPVEEVSEPSTGVQSDTGSWWRSEKVDDAPAPPEAPTESWWPLSLSDSEAIKKPEVPVEEDSAGSYWWPNTGQSTEVGQEEDNSPTGTDTPQPSVEGTGTWNVFSILSAEKSEKTSVDESVSGWFSQDQQTTEDPQEGGIWTWLAGSTQLTGEPSAPSSEEAEAGSLSIVDSIMKRLSAIPWWNATIEEDPEALPVEEGASGWKRVQDWWQSSNEEQDDTDLAGPEEDGDWEEVRAIMSSIKGDIKAVWILVKSYAIELYHWDGPRKFYDEWKPWVYENVARLKDTAMVVKRDVEWRLEQFMDRPSLELTELEALFIAVAMGSLLLAVTLYLLSILFYSEPQEKRKSKEVHDDFVVFPEPSSELPRGTTSELLRSLVNDRTGYGGSRLTIPMMPEADSLSNAASAGSESHRDSVDESAAERSDNSEEDTASNVASLGEGSVAMPPSESTGEAEELSCKGEAIGEADVQSSYKGDARDDEIMAPTERQEEQPVVADGGQQDRDWPRRIPSARGKPRPLARELSDPPSHQEQRAFKEPQAAQSIESDHRNPVARQLKVGPDHVTGSDERKQKYHGKGGNSEGHRRKRKLEGNRMEVLPAVDVTHLPEMTKDGGEEYGDNDDEGKGWRNPFKIHNGNTLPASASDEKFHTPRNISEIERRPHPPGGRQNPVEVIDALRGKGK